MDVSELFSATPTRCFVSKQIFNGTEQRCLVPFATKQVSLLGKQRCFTLKRGWLGIVQRCKREGGAVLSSNS